MKLAALVMLGGLALALRASAEGFGGVDVGGMAAIPSNGNPTFQFGGGGEVEGGAVIAERWLVGARLSWELTTQSGNNGNAPRGTPPEPTYLGHGTTINASLTGGVLVVVRPRWRLAIALNTGFGFWSACIGSDTCGLGGPAVGLELRCDYHVSPHVDLHYTFENLLLIGLGASPQIELNTLWLGLRFH